MKATEGDPLAQDGRGFLSRGQVASLFGVSVSTVTRWARTGMIPALRTPGGHYRFRSEDFRGASPGRFSAPHAEGAPESDS